MTPSSTFVMLSILHLISPSQIILNQCNKKAIVNSETAQTVKLWMNYFVHMVVPMQQILSKLMTPSRFYGSEQTIEMFINQIEDAQIFVLCTNLGYNLPCLIIHALNNITSVFFAMKSIASTTNTRLVRLIRPHQKFEQQLDQCSSGNMTSAHIATNDESISTFNTVVANLAAQCKHGNNTISQLSESNQ